MSKDETARELEKLRADVAALSDVRREAAAKPAEPLPVVEERPAAEDAAGGAAVLQRRLGALARAGGAVEIEISYRGWHERFPNASRNADLRAFLSRLPHSRFFRESLTLGAPQTCVH